MGSDWQDLAYEDSRSLLTKLIEWMRNKMRNKTLKIEPKTFETVDEAKAFIEKYRDDVKDVGGTVQAQAQWNSHSKKFMVEGTVTYAPIEL